MRHTPRKSAMKALPPQESPLGQRTITVKGGLVTDVSGLPDDWCYEVNDLDALEAEAAEQGAS